MTLLLVTCPRILTLIPGFFELFLFLSLSVLRHAHFFLDLEEYQETICKREIDIKPEIEAKLESIMTYIKEEKA